MSRRAALVTRWVIVAALLAAVGGMTLPERPRPLDSALQPGDTPMPPVIAGAFHVHTNRSDGRGTVAEVAAAAARAGLSFVVVTDHGDGTRVPDPPTYYGDVLVLDGVEIRTTQGHYLSVGQEQAPYPLGGEPRDVAEDVRRLGGFGVAAHPGSPKDGLRWHAWSTAIDGLEWLNGDSTWRDEAWYRLGLALLQYPMRAPAAMAALFERPVETLLRWDGLTQRRRVVALAGSDAHGAPALPGADDWRVQPLALPSYEQVFRTFAIRVQLDELWSGDATADAVALLEGLREGRVYTVLDALAIAGRFHFSAAGETQKAQAGSVLPAGAPVRVTVRAGLPTGAEIRLYENGALVHWTRNPELHYVSDGGRSVFRAEVVLPWAPGIPAVPWIVSNPIYIGLPPAPRLATSRVAAGRSVALFTDELDPAGWTVEHEGESLAAVESTATVDGQELALRYALSGGDSGSPFAALVRSDAGMQAHVDRIRFTVRGDRAQRISVQLRNGPAGVDLRWRRSVYVGTDPRRVTIRLQEMRPVPPRTVASPRVEEGTALLFVVDSVNTPPATSGVIWLDDVRLESSEPSPDESQLHPN